MRIGHGYDVHRFILDRDLILGGVKIPNDMGLLGHSDADVLIHAICDALLGAANMRDIGYHFPDNAGEFKNIDSKILLARVVSLVRSKGWEIGNVDVTIAMQRPKLAPYIMAMRETMAGVMGVSVEDVSVKATTTEKLGFVGRGEGCEVYATALLNK